jgi:hypothetical protein
MSGLKATGTLADTGRGAYADSALARPVLALLAIDGVVSGIVGAFLLPLYLGPVPFPVSAVFSGLMNAALVWAASYWTHSKKLVALPLWTWLATVAVLSLGGPGGDIVFGGPGIMGLSVLILFALGALPAAMLLRRMP